MPVDLVSWLGQTTASIVSVAYDSFSSFHLWAGTSDGNLLLFGLSSRLYTDDADDGTPLCEGTVTGSCLCHLNLSGL